jgi:hypothetical protein
MTIKRTKRKQNVPNGLKMYLSTYSTARPSKIFPNLDSWFENIPSGNPVSEQGILSKELSRFRRQCVKKLSKRINFFSPRWTEMCGFTFFSPRWTEMCDGALKKTFDTGRHQHNNVEFP